MSDYEYTCKNKFCDNEVRIENTLCAECKQYVRDLHKQMEKEDRALEKREGRHD